MTTLAGSVAFEWTQDIHNGSTVHRCVGDDVTLRWSYVTRSDENVMAIFWYSDKNGTIASRFFNHYMTSSSRVTYEPNAGVTLSGLSTDDEGMYGVQVRMFGTPRLQTQVVKLVVVGEKAAVVVFVCSFLLSFSLLPLFFVVVVFVAFPSSSLSFAILVLFRL